MELIAVQKIWKIGKAPVVTIPKEVREAIPGLTPGNYVKVYVSRGKMVIEPIDFSEYRKKVAESVKSIVELRR